jgi:hypothetical protein
MVSIRVCVRKRGAIGMFYWYDFACETREEWYKNFSAEWELYCFHPDVE